MLAIDRLQLRGARLLLRPHDAGEARYGVLVIPESAASVDDLQADIVAVGPDLADRTLAAGLTVIVRKTRRTYLEDDLWICDEAQVLAVVEAG